MRDRRKDIETKSNSQTGERPSSELIARRYQWAEGQEMIDALVFKCGIPESIAINHKLAKQGFIMKVIEDLEQKGKEYIKSLPESEQERAESGLTLLVLNELLGSDSGFLVNKAVKMLEEIKQKDSLLKKEIEDVQNYFKPLWN
jgi:hypothetical protein